MRAEQKAIELCNQLVEIEEFMDLDQEDEDEDLVEEYFSLRDETGEIVGSVFKDRLRSLQKKRGFPSELIAKFVNKLTDPDANSANDWLNLIKEEDEFYEVWSDFYSSGGF